MQRCGAVDWASNFDPEVWRFEPHRNLIFDRNRNRDRTRARNRELFQITKVIGNIKRNRSWDRDWNRNRDFRLGSLRKVQLDRNSGTSVASNSRLYNLRHFGKTDENISISNIQPAAISDRSIVILENIVPICDRSFIQLNTLHANILNKQKCALRA